MASIETSPDLRVPRRPITASTSTPLAGPDLTDTGGACGVVHHRSLHASAGRGLVVVTPARCPTRARDGPTHQYRPLGPRALIGALGVALVLAAASVFGVDVAPGDPPADPCAAMVALGPVDPGVQVIRGGVPVAGPTMAQAGDVVQMGVGGQLLLTEGANRYLLRGASATLDCDSLLVSRDAPPARTLALTLHAGEVGVQAPTAPAVVVTPEALTVAPHAATSFVVSRPLPGRTRVVPRDQPIELAGLAAQGLRLTVRPTQKGLMDSAGLRLDTYPFAISTDQRAARPSDGLVPFWADGRRCSVGCRAPGAIPGWPLSPFHRQHALRSALNELRPANFHVALDIQARGHQRVYAMSSGPAHVIQASGPDERVQVGHFVYWHIDRTVHEGQPVRAYRTPLGRVKGGFGHVALSEVVGSAYINPLRPGGRNLSPWSDTEPPVIGKPRVLADGRAIVDAFDPQSFVAVTSRYETPVLAPAALAWRLFDASGHSLTPLEWALRGSQNLPANLRPQVFAPGATNPGFWCFVRHRVCRPTWRYWLAGGLTRRLPLATLGPGLYRLSVYAWDWAGNTSARDLWFHPSLLARRAIGANVDGGLHPRPDRP